MISQRGYLKRRRLENALLSIAIVLIAVVAGGLLVLASGRSPVDAYGTIFYSTFGTANNLLYTLSQSAPLIIVSLGLLIAFRSSFWNGGGEGQMLLGGMVGIIVSYVANVKFAPVELFLGFAGAFVAGGAWAAISGILKVRYRVDDIVSTLLLAQVAALFVFYLVRVPFAAPTVGASVLASVTVPAAAVFPSIGGINGVFILALVLTAIVYFVMTRTKFGFRIKVMGSNMNTAVAYYGKAQTSRLFVLSSFLSGGLIGIGGMVMASAFTNNVVAGATGGAYSSGGFTNSYGFIGIAIVFLAQLDALAVIPASIFFVALVIGGLGLLVLMQIPTSLTISISGIAIIFISARLPIIDRLNRLRRRRPIAV